MTLSQEHGAITRKSDNIMGTSNEILGNEATIIFPGINISNILNNPISYSARAIAQNGSNSFEFGEQIDGAVSIDSNCEFSSI